MIAVVPAAGNGLFTYEDFAVKADRDSVPPGLREGRWHCATVKFSHPASISMA